MPKQLLTMEHILLGLLRQQPMHGYEIYQRLLSSPELSRLWRIKQSLLYATLNRLEADGLIISTIEPHGQKPPRKILRLTQAGEVALHSWIRSPITSEPYLQPELLAKISFARREHPRIARELVARQRQATLKHFTELRRQIGECEPQHSYIRLILHADLAQSEAALAWLDSCADWIMSHEDFPRVLSSDPPGSLPG